MIRLPAGTATVAAAGSSATARGSATVETAAAGDASAGCSSDSAPRRRRAEAPLPGAATGELPARLAALAGGACPLTIAVEAAETGFTPPRRYGACTGAGRHPAPPGTALTAVRHGVARGTAGCHRAGHGSSRPVRGGRTAASAAPLS